MAQSKILVGLEIGTSKTCMVVGEIRPDATATIIGIGEVASAGVRKGEIVDQAMARQCVCDAWQLAQDHASVDIVNVYLSVTGNHIQGNTNKGSYRLPDDEDIISEEHVDYATENAETVELAAERYVLNRELGGYSIDGGDSIYHPVGMAGRTLDVNCHIMHGVRTRLQNSLLCVRDVPLNVEDIVFAPLATAQMVLSRRQKEQGALLIDIGGGTTDFICYKGGNIEASGCIPEGGNTINQHIVRKTDQRVSNKAAEVLKCTEGNAFGDLKDRSLAYYKSEFGMHDVSIPRGDLNRYIRDSLAITLDQVRSHIPKELFRNGGMQVYLSGGTGMMRGLDALTRYIFYNAPVFQPDAQAEGPHHSYLSDPRYCTAIGLIRYAQRYDDEALYPQKKGFWGRIGDMFRRAR